MNNDRLSEIESRAAAATKTSRSAPPFRAVVKRDERRKVVEQAVTALYGLDDGVTTHSWVERARVVELLKQLGAEL